MRKKTEEKFGITTGEIKRMGLVMKSHFVSEVCMENTGIYWIPVWRLLENDFIAIFKAFVNAEDALTR